MSSDRLLKKNSPKSNLTMMSGSDRLLKKIAQSLTLR